MSPVPASPMPVPFRVSRALTVAAATLLLAAAAHLSAGGHLPPAPVMAALSAIVILTAVLVAGRRLTAPVLAAYLASGQFTLHLAFSALASPNNPQPGAGAGASTGAHVHALPVHAPVPAGTVTAHEHLSTDTSPLMLGLHLAAILATALIMARGEAAVWAVAHWLRPLLGLPQPAAVESGIRIPVRAWDAVPARSRSFGRPPVRGPPADTKRPLPIALPPGQCVPVGA